MNAIIGRRLEGRYEINELIGIGGMANVYKAIDVSTQRVVAVKVLREEFYSNDEFIRRFKNESKAIALLSHPNIIKVFDVCLTGRIKSIVMEYVDGITLKEYQETQGALPWRDALHFVLQILRALEHAHSKGIVHRDIKPQNVMLLPDGQIKLTDFGIVRFARGENKTLTNRAIGSVHYISPEQAKGGHIDQRADIYSVGVMLYEMLSGRLPFDDDSPVSVALKQIQLEAPLLENINPDIPRGLADITARAMQKNPAERYQSAAQFLMDIERFQKNPSAQFEYKYLANEAAEKARYRKAIEKAREEGAGVPNVRKPANAAKTSRIDQRQMTRESGEYARRWSALKVLAGITASFVAITLAFMSGMLYFNNPLEKVPEVRVPELVGKTLEQVLDDAQYHDFVLQVGQGEYSDTFGRGTIIAQLPGAGKTVKTGSTIIITPSSGKRILTVPALIGLEETDAYRMLSELDIAYQKEDVYSPYPSGTVVMTDPMQNTEVSGETVVTLQISKGPENREIQVPNVVNKSLDEAMALIKQADLDVGGISYVSSELPYGTVTAQDPSPDMIVMTKELINLNVSGGPDMKTRITLNIPMPENMTEAVKLQVMHDNNIIQQASVVPASTPYWRPAFEGRGKSTLIILFNDFLYMRVELDFDNGQWTVIEDNTDVHS